MKTAYLGLGTNLGEREGNLLEAARRLAADQRVTVLRASSIYETAPREMLDQPWFLNQVLEIETELLPVTLFQRAKRVEREMGRRQGGVRYGPRVIDIDILLYGDAVVDTELLQVPHPRIAERRFVLEPLAELVPALRHPVLKRSMRELLAGVAGQEIRKRE